MGTVNGRIEALRREHSDLDREIIELEAHTPQSERIRDMKKRKLAIKDELQGLEEA